MDSALAFFDAALMARRLLDPEGAKRLLTEVNVDRRLKRDMEATHRGNISRAHLDHPMMAAARAAGYESLNDLAEALGYGKHGKSFLSRVLSGDKKLPSAKAEKFRALTGKSWKA